jgi:DNA polymerase-3 subunit delta'
MSFEEIIGHKEAIGFLEAAYAAGRLGHAYLFAGPAGVGKARTARVFAALLLCELPKGARACGVCASCAKVKAGQHPDLKVLEPDGEFIKIEAVREAGRFVGLKPFEGRHKVLIVDPASAMNEEAANALLKTLEEPSAHTTLILIAEDWRGLPGTIVSRCQRVFFGTLASEDIALFLVDRLGLGRSAADDLSRLCGGSVGEALRFHEDGVLARRDALLRFLSSDDPVRGIDELTGGREEALRLLQALALWYRDLLAVKTSGTADLLMHPVGYAVWERVSGEMETQALIRSLDVVAQTCLDVRRHANLRLAFEQMRTQLWTLSRR